jgi:hypothetical protein
MVSKVSCRELSVQHAVLILTGIYKVDSAHRQNLTAH